MATAAMLVDRNTVKLYGAKQNCHFFHLLLKADVATTSTAVPAEKERTLNMAAEIIWSSVFHAMPFACESIDSNP